MKRNSGNGGNGKPRKKRLPAPQKPPNSKKGPFLAALMASGGHIGKACEAVPVDRTTVYEWRQKDEQFEIAYHEAMEHGADVLEDAARARAIDGVYRLKFGKDGECHRDPETNEPYREMVFSDTLLIFLLKGIRPEKFRERHDVRTTGTVKVELSVKDRLDSLPAAIAERVRAATGLN